MASKDEAKPKRRAAKPAAVDSVAAVPVEPNLPAVPGMEHIEAESAPDPHAPGTVIHPAGQEPPVAEPPHSDDIDIEIVHDDDQPVESHSADDGQPPVESDNVQVPADDGGKKKPKSRRRKIIEIAAVVILLIAGGGAWWWFGQPVKTVLAPEVKHKTPSPTPALVDDPLTGLQVAASAAAQPVVGVMVENLDPDARPQSGLGQAGVVYEALAEGGITRFLAIFQEPLPPVIGPVRSLRPYYLDWGLEYNIPVAHAGGSQPALFSIKPLGLKDINALAYDGTYFYRASDRVAPHNLYTKDVQLTAVVQKLGFATAPSFTPLPRKADAPIATPPHPTIDINFSYAGYAVEYRYDAKSNSYARFMGGAPHVDRNTGQQIFVKNVVVEFVPTTYSTQADGKPETDMNLIGSGKALVFEDGGVVVGTWSKASDSAQTKLLDASGQPIKFNRGNTWYSVVPTVNTVNY